MLVGRRQRTGNRRGGLPMAAAKPAFRQMGGDDIYRAAKTA